MNILFRKFYASNANNLTSWRFVNFSDKMSHWKHSDEFEKAKQQSSQQSRSYGAQSGGDFSDFFESMFGGAGMAGGRSRQARYRGEDFNAELQLGLIDAYTTHKQTIAVNDKNIRITIPAGVENGQTIKIIGHGGQGTNGGPNGDLIITFKVSNHEKYKRLGNTVYLTVDIDLYTAILGGEITIETLSGKVKLNVKPGTQNGSKIKLTGKGFPVYKSEGFFGDLIVTFNILIPKEINEKQKALFTELSKM